MPWGAGADGGQWKQGSVPHTPFFSLQSIAGTGLIWQPVDGAVHTVPRTIPESGILAGGIPAGRGVLYLVCLDRRPVYGVLRGCGHPGTWYVAFSLICLAASVRKWISWARMGLSPAPSPLAGAVQKASRAPVWECGSPCCSSMDLPAVRTSGEACAEGIPHREGYRAPASVFLPRLCFRVFTSVSLSPSPC